MSRFRFGTRVDRVFGASSRRGRRAERRFHADSLPGVEILEGRVLLANLIPSGVISSKPDGSNFDYTIELTNSSESTSSIGTFWYAWTAVPFYDFLATKPISVTPPAGWTDTITNVGASDGYAIEYISSSPSDNVQPGSTLGFSFTSADTPASVNGDSVFYPGTPVGTSVVYTGAAFATPSAQFVVTPAAPTLSSISVTPANPSLLAGKTEQFTATGAFSDGSTENLTSQVTWASATTSVATISNAAGSQGLATAVAKGTSNISATLDGISGSTLLTVTAPLVSIAVTPANPSIPKGETEQFIATGTLADGSTENLTSQVTWASATTATATVSNAPGSQGLAAGLATGTSTISATLAGITGSTVLTVSPAVLVSITVTANQSSIAQGTTDQFTATGQFSDNTSENVTGMVVWASTNPSAASITAAGLATGLAPGSSLITATLLGVTGSAGFGVTTPSVPLPPS